MLVSPRLVGNRGSRLGRRSGRTGLRLTEIAGNVDTNPFLRVRDGVTGIPLVLASGIGGAVGDIGVAGSTAASRRGVLAMAVCQSDGRAIVNLGETGIGNCWVSLDQNGRLVLVQLQLFRELGLGWLGTLVVWVQMGISLLLDIGNYKELAHF